MNGLTARWAGASEAGLPADVHGVLSGDPVADHRALDVWTVKRTGGLIDRMPVPLTEDKPWRLPAEIPYDGTSVTTGRAIASP
ncbi:hypothetical protein ACWD3J_45875 [Streptomyces sp. NPDC002755]|uniref:hypothetical protein n=1 Tax=Streptomyces sp. NPDC002884 TaxID=3154544 RepID=UPI0033343810